MDNLTVVGKIGETGKVITVVLKESNALGAMVAKDLTGYTSIKMQVERSNGTAILNQVDCVVDADPTTGRITCTLDMLVATYANLKAGTYRLEFSGLNATGKKRYWPMNAVGVRTYGKFIVQDALS